jgi:LmbE family N-acetylglucosaminyl deacetylase
MPKVLFVSPHLDDAVFSCAARILREVDGGTDVTVATVFSHARPRSPMRREYVARQEEDRIALGLLGAKPLWLGLLDAPCRSPFYNSFRRIVLETAPGDGEFVQVVRTRIARLVEDLSPDAIHLPLGVGTHIDHRLVFAACSPLTANRQCYFYEDQPYALVRFSVQMRFREIGAAPFSRASGASRKPGFLRSFRAAAYVRRYLPPGQERRDCEAQLCQKLSARPKPTIRLQSEIEAAHASDQRRILSALYAYRSQVRTFFGGRKYFKAACAAHARWLGLKCWRAERLWKFTGTENTKSNNFFANCNP